ncbi:MAG: SPFH domain-containing protein [Candidatus Asgardarchaeia archaeon]
MALPLVLNPSVISAAAKVGFILLGQLTAKESSGEGLFGKISSFFKGRFNVVVWDKTKNPGLVWRIPDPNADEDYLKSLSKIDGIVVRTGELAIYSAAGILQPLPAGIWKLDKKVKKRPGGEIAYVNVTTFPVRWGISREAGPLSKDGLKIGISGEARVIITDPAKFVFEVAKAKRLVTEDDVKEWIMSDIISILRDQISKMNAEDITNDALQIAVQAKGERELPKYGLKIEKLNVMYVSLPPAYVMAKEQHTVSKIYGETELNQAMIEAQKRKIIGETELELKEKEMKLKTGVVSELASKAGEVGAGIKVKGEEIEIKPESVSPVQQVPSQTITPSQERAMEAGQGSQLQFCPYCGKKLPATAGLQFCPYCGKKLPI